MPEQQLAHFCYTDNAMSQVHSRHSASCFPVTPVPTVSVQEFGHSIDVNQNATPNYGDRYRQGETISTSFVESAVNQVVSKRMVKRQQMRWNKRVAHLLLQVRTQGKRPKFAQNHSVGKGRQGGNMPTSFFAGTPTPLFGERFMNHTIKSACHSQPAMPDVVHRTLTKVAPIRR